MTALRKHINASEQVSGLAPLKTWGGEDISSQTLAQVAALALPALQLVPTEDDEQAVLTIGGHPRVPEGFSWPHRHELLRDRQPWPHQRGGQPLSFLCAIDLDRIEREHGPWPQAQLSGMLLLFIEPDMSALEYGVLSQGATLADHAFAADRDDYLVVHITSEQPVYEHKAPASAICWARQQFAAHAIATTPSSISAEMRGTCTQLKDALIAVGEQLEEKRLYSDLYDRRLPQHQLLGWRDGVQHDPRHHCPAQTNSWYDSGIMLRWLMAQRDKGLADEQIDELMRQLPDDFSYEFGSHDPWATEQASDWAHMLTLASDEQQGHMWGDLGEIHLLIRRDDLAAGRFDRVYLTWQCH